MAIALLLLLIQKEEMRIRDLDLTKITQQYLGYLAKLEELDFNVAGDYLYLASTLILLKSKDCLSEEDEKNIKSFTEIVIYQLHHNRNLLGVSRN